MSRLECGRCKSVYQDVVRVRRCPLCGNTSFSNADETRGKLVATITQRFPWWFVRESNLGFRYEGNVRLDKSARLD